MLLANRKTGAILCNGHDAKWFRRIPVQGEEPEAPEAKPKAKPPIRERRAGDRLTSLEVPFAGELAAIEYLHDTENPSIALRFLGHFPAHFSAVIAMECVTLDIGGRHLLAAKDVLERFPHRSRAGAGGACHRDDRVSTGHLRLP